MIELTKEELEFVCSRNLFGIFGTHLNPLLPKEGLVTGKAKRKGNTFQMILTHPAIYAMFLRFVENPASFNLSASEGEIMFEICYRNGLYRSQKPPV